MSKMQRTRSTMRQEQPKQTTNSVVPQKKEQGKKSMKRGKPARKAGGTASIEEAILSGNVEVGQRIDIDTQKSITIGKLVNTGSATLPVNLESDRITIKTMEGPELGEKDDDTDNVFAFTIGPGKERGSEDKPIDFISANNNTDIQCTWGTKKVEDYASLTDDDSNRGYYVHVYGQYFNGNTTESAVDDDYFAFWEDENDIATIDENTLDIYNNGNVESNPINKKKAQYYFIHTPGYLLRTDKVIEKGTNGEDTIKYIDILMLPGDEYEGTNYDSTKKSNQIFAKYNTERSSDDISETGDYKGEFYYPFRLEDKYTVSIENGDRSQLQKINKYSDVYTNNLVFDSMNKTQGTGENAVEIHVKPKEQILFDQSKLEGNNKYIVKFKDTSYLDKSVKQIDTITNNGGSSSTGKITEQRYNDKGVYLKSDTIPNAQIILDGIKYNEQMCDEWIIDKDISDTKFGLLDTISYNKDKQDMIEGVDNDKNGKDYTFREKKVYIINGKDISDSSESIIDTHGKIQVGTFNLRGCTDVELQEECTIKCNELII